MALSLKNAEAERLARLVAEQTGETITEAIHNALAERLQRLQARRSTRLRQSQISDLLRRVDSMPELDARTPDQILGYDENGLPH